MLKILKRWLGFKDSSLKRPPYDAMLSWEVNDSVCSLNCDYCFFEHVKEKVPALDVDALLNTINKTGKIFKIILIGSGEPFMVPNIIEICRKITQNHYLEFITNLVSNKYIEFCDQVDPGKVIKIVASLHLKELERRKLIDRYIRNYLYMQKKGMPISAHVVAYPAIIPEVNHYKAFFKKKEINIIFDEFQGEYNSKKYPESYTKEERKLLGFESYEKFQEKHYQKGKLCNVGYNAGIIASTGNIYPCFLIHDPLGNINEGSLTFRNEMLTCPIDFCYCPLNILNPELFEIALRENT